MDLTSLDLPSFGDNPKQRYHAFCFKLESIMHGSCTDSFRQGDKAELKRSARSVHVPHYVKRRMMIGPQFITRASLLIVKIVWYNHPHVVAFERAVEKFGFAPARNDKPQARPPPTAWAPYCSRVTEIFAAGNDYSVYFKGKSPSNLSAQATQPLLMDCFANHSGSPRPRNLNDTWIRQWTIHNIRSRSGF
jgi:hypothetical protein